MKKKILASVLTMLMLIAVLQVTAFAATSYNVTDDGNDLTGVESDAFYTFDEAARAAVAGDSIVISEDVTYTLTGDTTLAASLNVAGVKFTIDLNGHKLTVAGDNKFSADAEVTIKNGTLSITGAVANGDAIFCVGNYSTDATVTLENVDVIGDGYSSAYAVFYVYGTSTLNISGGSVKVANDNASAGGVFKAESAADGKINIVGTESDPVELQFTDAKIGFLNGTVKFDYIDLDIEGGANAINQSALTVSNSTLTIKNCNGRALTLKEGDVSITNSTLEFSGATEGEIRFKEGVSLITDEATTISECEAYADASATGANINSTAIPASATETTPATITVASGTAIVDEYEFAAKIGTVGYTSIEAALANVKAGEVVKISEGTYTPATTSFNLPDNVSIEGEGEVTITKGLSFTANGIYVKNIDIVAPSENGLKISGNGTFESCNITAYNGTRYCYANNGDVSFKNCVITGTIYGIHFDGGSGEGSVIIENCTITGWTSFGRAVESLTIKDTEFLADGYPVLRFYQDATVTNCTFPADTASYPDGNGMRIDTGSGGEGMDDITVEFANCSTDDPDVSVKDMIPGSVTDKTDIVIDGAAYVAPVAQVGDTVYTDIWEAFYQNRNVENVTIVLLRDFTTADQLTVSKNITFDLNGNTLTSTATNAIYIYNYGNLIIEDSVGGGAIVAAETGIKVGGGGSTATLTVNGGEIDAAVTGVSVSKNSILTLNDGSIDGDSWGVALGGDNTTINVNDGIITGETGISSHSSYVNTEININGGEVNGTVLGIYHPQNGELNISDGTVTGYSAIDVKSGTINITGGNISGTGEVDAYEFVGGGIATGDALIIESAANSISAYETPVVSISGGVFTSTNGKAVVSYAAGASDTAVGGFINGGTFSSPVDSTYCAENWQPVELGDGTYGVGLVNEVYIGDVYYTTLADALAAAADGDEIVLMGDLEYTTALEVNKAVTINGAGYTISSTASRAFNVSADATFKDITIEATGERGINIIAAASDVTLDNVSLSGVTHYAVNVTNSGAGSSVTIKNSSISSWAAINLWGEGTSANVVNSELIGNNIYADNSFGTIVLNGKNNVVNVTGGSITSSQTEGSRQYIVQMSVKNGADSSNSAVTLSETTALIACDEITSGVIAQVGNSYYASIEDAMTAAEAAGVLEIVEVPEATITVSLGVTVKSATDISDKLAAPTEYKIVKSGDDTNGYTYTVAGTVRDITIDPVTAMVNYGKTAQFTAVVTGTTDNKNVIWTVEGATDSTVSDTGLLTIGANERTKTITVTATAADDATKAASATITVIRKGDVASVVLSDTVLALDLNEARFISATVLPVDAVNKDVIWTSSDETVAKVIPNEYGAVIVAEKSGTATVTVTTVDGGFTASCAVTVSKELYSGTIVTEGTLTITPNGGELVVGQKLGLDATISPAMKGTPLFYSSDVSVAYVDVTSGVLTAVAPGTVVITAIWSDTLVGSTAVFTVVETATPVTPAPTLNGEPSDWAKNEIIEALALGLVPEHINGNYTKDITRSQFCDIIINLIEKKSGKAIADVIAGYEDAVAAIAFTDTNNPNVTAASQLGIVNGRATAGIFDPDANITRQEAAKMLAMAAKVLDADIKAEPVQFADADSIYEWAKEFVYCVNSIGVMNGTSTGENPNFSPLRTYSIEQSILTILRLFKANI